MTFTASGSMATSKRRLLFDPAPPGKRKKLSPLDDAQFFKIPPIPGCTPENSKIITFSYTTGKHPIRFLQEPICIKYTVTATGAGNANLPFDGGQVYLDPSLSVTTFIKGCEIDLDNTNVFKDATGRHAIYQAMNRRFTTTKIRQAHGFSDPHLIHGAADIAAAVGDKAVARMKCGADGYSHILTGSLDGNPLLGAPRNFAVESLTNETAPENNRPVLIPPFTTINIRLELREKLTEHVLVKAAALQVGGLYWTTEVGDDDIEWAAERHPAGLQVKIEDITLLAERLIFNDEKAIRLLKGENLSYFFDFPTFVVVSVPAGVSEYPVNFIIPPGTPLVYVAFMAKHQISEDRLGGERPSDPSKFVLPPDLRHISFRLNSLALLFEKGIEVSANEPSASVEYKLYHNYLTEENLTDLPYERFCPPVTPGFDNVFVLNLCDAAFSQPATLTVTPTFQTGAPTNWYCVMVMPTEKKFKKSRAGWDNSLTT